MGNTVQYIKPVNSKSVLDLGSRVQRVCLYNEDHPLSLSSLLSPLLSFAEWNTKQETLASGL
jgi:hypothetical protein